MPSGYISFMLRNSKFRRFWFSSVISWIGEWFNTIALFFLILDYSGSEFLLGILFSVRMALFAISQPIVGVMADRFGRRKVFFIGWGSFSVLSGIFGFMIIIMPELPVWFQGFYLIVHPFCVAVGTVGMFALAMALSWSKASATMFTSYMAISNLSVVIGNKLIGPLSNMLSIGQIYVIMMFVCLTPVVLLKSMDPRPILDIKLKHE